MFFPRLIKIAAAFALLAVAVPRSYGRTTQELIADLRTALKDTSASPSDRANEELIRQLSQSATPGSNGVNVNGDIRNISQILVLIAAQTRSDKVRRLCQEIDIQLRVEKEQMVTALPAKADEMVKRTGEAVLAAKSPRDLDALLQEINRLQEGSKDFSSESGQRINEQLRAAHRLVTRWQNYLGQQTGGSADSALQSLKDIVNDPFVIVPRPEVQSRIQALVDSKTAQGDTNKSPVAVRQDAIVASAKQPSDLAAAAEQMRVLRQQFPRETDYQLAQELERLDLAYKQIRTGVTPNIGLTANSRFSDLQMQLYLLALPRFLSAPADLRPRPDESPSDYLDRVTAAAKDTGNWPLLLKVLEAPRTLLVNSSGGGSGTTTGTSALKAFIVAQNNEQAGQFASAVVSYRAALADVDNVVPLTVVRDHLAAIKKDHAAEYEAGMQQPLPTPSPRYPPNFQRDPQTGRIMMPGAASAVPGAAPGGVPASTGPASTRPQQPGSPSPTPARRTLPSGQ